MAVDLNNDKTVSEDSLGFDRIRQHSSSENRANMKLINLKAQLKFDEFEPNYYPMGQGLAQ